MYRLVFGGRAARIVKLLRERAMHRGAVMWLPANRNTLLRASLALAAMFALFTPTVAQTWVGDFFGVWNQPLNWSPNVIPNSPTADVIFTGSDFLPINVITSVQTQSLTFSNPSGVYTLTSNGGVGLSGVKEINVAAGVTGTQTINLGNVAAPGSLRFAAGSNLQITNNSTAAGTTLVFGPNTVIGTPGFGSVGVNGPGTTQISGGLSAPTPNRIVGGLAMNGSGTLILAHPVNNYMGGTNVNDGTLMLGHGTAIPTGSNVFVYGDGVFNTGGFSNGGQLSSSNAIGTLSLSSASTFRVPTGSGDYWLNSLTMTGGTVDFTGTTNFWLHLRDALAGVITTASSTTATWIGAGASRIQNDTASPMVITVDSGTTASGIDLDAGINLSSLGNNPTFVKAGTGTMRLTSLGNTANITVNEGNLRVDDMAALGSGSLTLRTGIGGLQYGGPTESSTKNLTIVDFSGGRIQVLTSGANLTLNGVISGPGMGQASLFVDGPYTNGTSSTLTLTGANTYVGSTFIQQNAILAIPTIANSGVVSPISIGGVYIGAADSRGTLLLTGFSSAYSTNRIATVSGSYGNQAGGAIGVQNTSTNLTWAGKITGPGSFIKTGAGTLTLTNTTNSYTGATYVEAGTLNIGAAGAVIPKNSDVTVSSGATLLFSFPLGGNFGDPIGTITLDGGTMRLQALSANYNLNRLTTTAAGGTVDIVEGSLTFQQSFVGRGATINGNTTWTGGGKIFGNFNIAEPGANLAIAPGVTLNSSVVLSGVFDISGGGTLYVNANTPQTTNLTRFVVNQGRLRADDISITPSGASALGSLHGGATVILNGGALQYSGATDSTRMHLALNAAGGAVEVSLDLTTLTLTGAIDSSGLLTKTGPGVLILNNFANQYAGGIAVSGGRIDVGNDAQLGVAAVTVNPFGVLRYTATTTTAARNFTLNSGTLEVAAGVTLVMNNASVGGGFLRGTGTIELAGGTSLSGVTTPASTTIVQTGPASVTNFTNGGRFTVGAGQTLAWNSGTNTASGRIVVDGTANVSDPMELNGGLLVNNGTVTGTVNVNAGAVAMGSGSFGRVNVNRGGVYAPGNSPGVLTAASVLFDNAPTIVAGPTLMIELAGVTPGTGYDQLHVTGQLSLGGTLAVSLIEGFTPAAGNSFDILDWGTVSGTFSTLALPTLNGLAWNTSQLYTTGVLSIATLALAGDYNQNGVVDATDYVVWRNGLGTTYTQDHYNIWRANFGRTASTGSGVAAAVPEPATLALLMFAAAGCCLTSSNRARGTP